MPGWVRSKKITREKMTTMITAILPWLEKLEIFIKPRLEFVTRGLFSHLIGIFGLIMALSICVPLPLTNTVPSLGIALMAIGVIMRDGLAVLAGAITGILWICALAMIIYFLGTEGIDLIKDTIKDHI
jgi:hypothetical protein